jgi:NAD dependent epimerase/dehydratase family enzyme
MLLAQCISPWSMKRRAGPSTGAPEAARDFARRLGRVLRNRAWLRIPQFGMRRGLGGVSQMLIYGKRMVSQAALDNG